jgi:hypothetical protein
VKSPLARFVAATLLWLPLAFVVWYFAAPVLMAPVQWLCIAAAKLAFPDLVTAVELSGSGIAFATTLRPGQSAGEGLVAVDVNPLLYAYGMPMFAALVLAAREPRRWRYLAIGYAVLVPFVAFGVVADFLKNIAITAGPLVASQTGFGAVQREAIAFAFQFGSLILPTVVPAVLWVLLHRGFLERLRAAHAAGA